MRDISLIKLQKVRLLLVQWLVVLARFGSRGVEHQYEIISFIVVSGQKEDGGMVASLLASLLGALSVVCLGSCMHLR